MQRNVSFNSLAKSQHMKQVENQLSIFRQYCDLDNTFTVVDKQLRNLSKLNLHFYSLSLLHHLHSTKVHSNSFTFPNDQTLYQLLPPLSAYFIVHISYDKTILYLAFLLISQNKSKDYLLIKHPLSASNYSQIIHIIALINQIKSNTIKVPLLN